MIRTFAFDVGETLVRDDRYWGSWADWLNVPPHTVSALVGAVVARGQDNAEALRLIRPGIDLDAAYHAREEAGRGEYLDETDLYEDVRPALSALRQSGARVIIAGNQTVKAAALLRALDLPADLVATSGEWETAKPSPAFYDRLIAEAGVPAHEILYIGDHPQNDCFPARTTGLRTAHLRRGPWGHLWADDPTVVDVADHRINSLMDLVPLALQ
ncbi:HAD family hydrolase [Streptomyces sp. SID8385]|uniref:HAD-IA family hydrolase n=1 Tax=Streptomyces TaxID=1883 RepID=UPI001361A67A|nr:HAD-IA family hydrolase [Streptomyces sp. SID8385]